MHVGMNTHRPVANMPSKLQTHSIRALHCASQAHHPPTHTEPNCCSLQQNPSLTRASAHQKRRQQQTPQPKPTAQSLVFNICRPQALHTLAPSSSLEAQKNTQNKAYPTKCAPHNPQFHHQSVFNSLRDQINMMRQRTSGQHRGGHTPE